MSANICWGTDYVVRTLFIFLLFAHHSFSIVCLGALTSIHSLCGLSHRAIQILVFICMLELSGKESKKKKSQWQKVYNVSQVKLWYFVVVSTEFLRKFDFSLNFNFVYLESCAGKKHLPRFSVINPSPFGVSWRRKKKSQKFVFTSNKYRVVVES